MQKLDDRTEQVEQKRVARRYRRLGYNVHENPGPDRLPDFMRGAGADIVARSPSDNVVIEVKRHASLKGSNELVDVAARVSGHPDWRFELVVLPDMRDQEVGGRLFEEQAGRVRAAIADGWADLAVPYVVKMLVQAVHTLAATSKVAARGKDDQALLQDLVIQGILPDALVDRILVALKMRDDLAAEVSRQDVEDLLTLCEDVRAFL